MKENIPPQYRSLAKQISGVEIVIILILIIVWVSYFFLVNTLQHRRIETMTGLQENILALGADDLFPKDVSAGISWPFPDTFSFCVLKDDNIVASNLDMLEEADLTLTRAFGDFFNADEMILHFRREPIGTDWVRPDKLSPRKWISWSLQPDTGYVSAIISDEADLMALSGYQVFKRTALICAVLASALLLLALIWALSWMRLSAVKGLTQDPMNNQKS